MQSKSLFQKMKIRNKNTKRKNLGILAYLQRIGKSLLFPIAMLPFAAILLRVGGQITQGADGSDFSNFIGSLIFQTGNVVFNNLPIIFAVGVSFGLTKDFRGEAALVGFVTIVLAQVLLSNSSGKFGGINLVDSIYGNVNFGQITNSSGQLEDVIGFNALLGNDFNKIIADNVLTGFIIGIVVSIIYNKFNKVEMPTLLGFFSGRRLIPVLGFIFGLFTVILWALIFPWIGYGIFLFSIALTNATGNRYTNAGIMFAYGTINRLLIPFGLHHIPNTLFWFQLGAHPSAADPTVLVNGDINIFLNGAAKGNNSGTFQSGFFAVVMFGLPALAFSFVRNAENSVQKKRVMSLLFGSALVSFFTGITEPIEFSFLFISPLLFGLHAFLTGFFGFITGLFGIQIGFGFSAGLIDYALSIPKSLEIIAANKTGADAVFANPIWIWFIGAITASVYYFGSSFLIKKYNISSPGRGKNLILEEGDLNYESNSNAENEISNNEYKDNNSKYFKDSVKIIEGVGGKENIEILEWCATRLRFTLKDSSKLNKDLIKTTLSRGIINVGDKGVQIIIGPNVEIIGDEILTLIKQ